MFMSNRVSLVRVCLSSFTFRCHSSSSSSPSLASVPATVASVPVTDAEAAAAARGACHCTQIEPSTITKPKFYAVAQGRQPGIYDTWEACKSQVEGYRGSQYKSFALRREAERFLVESSASSSLPRDSDSQRPAEGTESETEVYQLEYDGASKGNPGAAGAGALLRHPDGSVVCELTERLGIATNNAAEYRALILGLSEALRLGIKHVRVQGDSMLVCQQVLGKWAIRNENLRSLCEEAKELTKQFVEVSIHHVDREYNSEADTLANKALEHPTES